MAKAGRILIGGLVIGALGAGCSSSDPCDEPGTACTYAGFWGPKGVTEKNGFNGEGFDRRETQLNWPSDITFDAEGNGWIPDWNSHRVRRIDAGDDTVKTMIGNGVEGDGDEGFDELYPFGDPAGAPGTEVSLNHPSDIVFAPDGTLYMASWHTNKVRTLDPETGIVKVLAGRGYGFDGDGGPAHEAIFDLPKALELHADGRLFVVDQTNQRIRAIEPDGERTITTIAGVGTKGYSGDGGPAIDAEFAMTPTGVPAGAIALDGDTLYIADTGNHRIRKMDLVDGGIECIAGVGTTGPAGDGGPAIDAELFAPLDLELGPDGKLYVADSGNHVVRAIDLTTGEIEHIAGTGVACPSGDPCFEADDVVPAAELRLNLPNGIAFDADGNLYIADTYNNRIVRVAR